ncbi:MAG: hypothetical protein LBH63_04895 [Clostridiales Family XIII bacterium]|jgi:molybdopterin converting factor small subunit|nr:hypothetical protein [Clostridiales Family XIII bacterium]
MEIAFKFIGMTKSLVDGKAELTLDVPENCTVEESLGILGIDCRTTKQFHFAAVNDKKSELERILQPGDSVKVFPRSFGG